MEAQPNIEPIFGANVVELRGKDGLSGIVVDRVNDGSTELAVDGLFVEIGADPRVDLARQLGVALNDLDEIIVDKHGHTNVEGVLAAGDVTDASGDLKQTINCRGPGGHSRNSCL